MTDVSTAGLVALDWGTTSCRAYLLSTDGEVLDQRSSDDGVMAVVRRADDEGRDRAACYEETFERLCGDWLEGRVGGTRATLPVVASGMVGSTQGWVEAEYLPIPLDLVGAAMPLTTAPAARGPVHIVPGLISTHGLPGVMRGEETELVGALLAQAGTDADAETDLVVILPGTHTKWARLRGSVIGDFTTCMTGEVYGLLASSSILGRLAEAPEATRWEAFDQGLEVAMSPQGAGGVLNTLFSARSLVLTDRLAPTDVLDYLSGLLVGSEVLGMQEAWVPEATTEVLLCGAEGLCSRYARALAAFGVEAVRASSEATPRALLHIARRAGLVPEAVPRGEGSGPPAAAAPADLADPVSSQAEAPAPATATPRSVPLPSRPGVAAPTGLVAILRGISPDEAEAVGAGLYEAGFRVLEVPLNSPRPLDTIRRLRDALPADARVGAGTVLDVGQVGRVQDAGGQLIVSPGTDADVVRETVRRGMAGFPGAATPTEALTAIRAGARAVKLFPADQVGIGGMRAWMAVLPGDVELVPVGGVDTGTIGDWVGAGATGFGIGSSLYRPGTALPELRRRAEELQAAWLAACRLLATRS